jgi:uncharacterized membrane protein YidH (DUF202 family)
MKPNIQSIWIRAGQIGLLVFNISFAVMALYFIFKGGTKTDASSGLEYKDFVSIMLTALSVMIALGAIFVAILAIWSYNNFKALVEQAAEKKAQECVGSWLEKEAPGVVREQLGFLNDATLGTGNDAKAADDMGENAG